MPVVDCLQFYSVCIPSVITPFSMEAVRLWSALDGYKRLRTPEEFYSQSAFWIDVCQTIDAEYSRIQREKMSSGKQ